ncbi:DegT/DnrJ/EryC1/StrS family aminotransferase [Acidobacteriota bacterium]
MNIPMLDLKAQYENIKDEINKKVLEILSSQRFILGPEVEALEQELAAYSGTKYACGVSSGSDALILSLMTLGIGHGDSVVTSPFTFFATAGAIVRVGAKPVFCDIEEETFNISPDLLKEVLETKSAEGDQTLKAVLPIHLYGQSVDMKGIIDLAQLHNLYVIEDAAQAVGAEYPSEEGVKRACAMGHLGILSFFPSKNLGGFGDGGMVLTSDKELSQRLKLLRTHGSKNKYFYDTIGGNFRLDALQAAVLRVKLKHLDAWHRSRMQNAVDYDGLFVESDLVKNGFVQTPATVYKNSNVSHYHVYNQYVIRAQRRDELHEFLKSNGVPTAIYYPLPLHLQECFSNLGYKKGDFPVSEKAAEEVLALPIYPELNKDQLEYVVSKIKEFYLA